eukprot:11195488-Lingulodinium_polyedra.AAC.1
MPRPCGVQQLTRGQLRCRTIDAVNRGNEVRSLFLHVALSCPTTIKIWTERRKRYQPVIVYPPQSCVDPVS